MNGEKVSMFIHLGEKRRKKKKELIIKHYFSYKRLTGQNTKTIRTKFI